MMPNPYQQYRTTQVQTASPAELVVLLYDAAVRSLQRAVIAIDQKSFDRASDDIIKAQDIVLELLAGLDFQRGGSLAANLRDCYLYWHGSLVQANVTKDVESIRTVIGLIEPVREAWRMVSRQNAGATGNLAAGHGARMSSGAMVA